MLLPSHHRREEQEIEGILIFAALVMAFSETDDCWRRVTYDHHHKVSSDSGIFGYQNGTTEGGRSGSNKNRKEKEERIKHVGGVGFIAQSVSDDDDSDLEDKEEHSLLLSSPWKSTVTIMPIKPSFSRSPSADSVKPPPNKRKRKGAAKIHCLPESKSFNISDNDSDIRHIDSLEEGSDHLETETPSREKCIRNSADLARFSKNSSEIPRNGHVCCSSGSGSSGESSGSESVAKRTKSWYAGENCSYLPDNEFKPPWRRFASVPEDTTGEFSVKTVPPNMLQLQEEEGYYHPSRSPPPSRVLNNNGSAVSTPETTGNRSGSIVSGSSSLSSSNAAKLSKWSRSKIDILMPGLRSFISETASKLSASRLSNASSNHRNSTACYAEDSATNLKRNASLNCVPTGKHNYEEQNHLRKCTTMVTLANDKRSFTTETKVYLEPLQPVNRLRPNAPNVQYRSGLYSRICSRCSSLLSMAASGSRYSLSSSNGFIPVKGPTVLCKVCLNEVPLKDSWTLQHCECSYCVDCVRSYVEFEINQGAFSISCPDAECEKQGIILLEEIESLVSWENIEKHKRFRLNKEVEMDKSRTWCPKAGCETVCTLTSCDRTSPQSVHCPTCETNFCSNCRATWHEGSACKPEEAIPGITFDSDLIKCCPMCSVPIEKDEGCAQMLCKRCKHVFCWYCLASLDDDFLLRHYDKGPCKNKLGHSRASVIWHRTQVISIFAGFGILLLIASPLLLLAAPCIVCCKCRVCTTDSKLDSDDDIPDIEYRPKTTNIDWPQPKGRNDPQPGTSS